MVSQWLAEQQPVASTRAQRRLDRFAGHYDSVRPHRALRRQTPAQAYTARRKAIARGPLINPPERVRRDIVTL